MSAGRILVVDDDPQIRRTLRAILAGQGYEPVAVASGEFALKAMEQAPFDLVLLDVRMGGLSGMDTCRLLRSRCPTGMAIIMLSAGRDEQSKIEALDAGANDYVVKPFSTPELLARMRAVLRRTVSDRAPVLKVGDADVDFANRKIYRSGETFRLTPKEFDLLRYFSNHRNRIIPHRELIQAIWGPGFGDEVEYLRVFINRLRRKIESDPANSRFLLTELNVGYRFVLPE